MNFILAPGVIYKTPSTRTIWKRWSHGSRPLRRANLPPVCQSSPLMRSWQKCHRVRCLAARSLLRCQWRACWCWRRRVSRTRMTRSRPLARSASLATCCSTSSRRASALATARIARATQRLLCRRPMPPSSSPPPLSYPLLPSQPLHEPISPSAAKQPSHRSTQRTSGPGSTPIAASRSSRSPKQLFCTQSWNLLTRYHTACFVSIKMWWRVLMKNRDIQYEYWLFDNHRNARLVRPRRALTCRAVVRARKWCARAAAGRWRAA